MNITFLGAADGVTGSRHLVQTGEHRILLDCGLFQGFKQQRERNWMWPEALASVDAVVLSHAHLDHSGYLPVLVKHGFRGHIHASPATCALARVLLLDSAHLQEEDARRANRYGYSRHAKALPLYTRADVERTLARFAPLREGQPLKLGASLIQLSPVGHLLGACAVRLQHRGVRLLFSGDVGRDHDVLMPPPAAPEAADMVVVESTYGNRDHGFEDSASHLATIVCETAARGGCVLMPAFAVGRAQALLLVLQRLRHSGAIPQSLPIFLDSPMAAEATALYLKYGKQLRVPPRELATLTEGVRVVADSAASMRLSASLGKAPFPRIVISASGMATGGRVLHHLKAMAPDPRHAIAFAGFQVGGSRGARLVAGESEVKIHGELVPVRAAVHHLQGFSGHADRGELLRWLRSMRGGAAPKRTFVVHGEAGAADALRGAIERELGWPNVRVPQHGEMVSL